MQQLLVLQKMNDAVKERFVQLLSPFFEIEFAQSFEPEYLKQSVKNKAVCFGSSLPDDVINEAEHLKVFQLAGTGVDRLNLKLLQSRNIDIYKTQTQSRYVAEFAVALLFDLLKKLSLFDRLLRQHSIAELRSLKGINNNSSTLLGKTVGIIGYGHIGKTIHHFLQPYNGTFLLNSFSSKPGNEADGANFTTLDELIEKADIIFVTCPLTESSKGLIGNKQFEAAKNSSIWINISRGPVVDFEALANALETKKIAGFALDNWYADVKDAELVLRKFDNTVLSPYRAINIDSDNPNINDAIDNLLKLGKGELMEHKVDYKKGY